MPFIAGSREPKRLQIKISHCTVVLKTKLYLIPPLSCLHSRPKTKLYLIPPPA